MAEHWSRAEVEATVATYLDMLEKELSGQRFSKTAHRRALQPLLRSRTDSAIERKFGNVSAALRDLGMPYVDGYKPFTNYQELLLEVADSQLDARPHLLALIEFTATKPADTPDPDFDDVLVEPPKRDNSARTYERPAQPRIRRGVDYLELESRNRSLGRAGEKYILAYERRRLWDAGRKALSERVEHVAETQGDGLGYDIHSFDASGRDRLIEVKTTRGPELTPFLVTPNELYVSEDKTENYHLYRLFRFEAPKLYIVSGSLRQHFQLDPDRYKARIV